jgi:hypothetical protein
MALPYTSRFSYIAIGGEHCFIHNILIENDEEETDSGIVPRIAEEVSFTRGCPEGDVPNIQIDDWCEKATEGIRVEKELTLTFHTKSLPTARLVWHCPYICLFTASDGKVKGENFREYLLLRFNGEDWSSDEHVENTVMVERREDFKGWDAWKEKNMEGFDCKVKIRMEKNRVLMSTENLGIAINTVSEIRDDQKDIFVAITGDQCAITDIHVHREG